VGLLALGGVEEPVDVAAGVVDAPPDQWMVREASDLLVGKPVGPEAVEELFRSRRPLRCCTA